jgi:hypothetical protein
MLHIATDEDEDTFGVMYLTNELFRMVNLHAIFRAHNYNVKRYINCLFSNIHS